MSGTTPQVATFAAGCFWGVEHIFLKHYPIAQNKGILKTSVGYTGGKENVTNPDYKLVCTGATDHAEALRIEFDPTLVKYDELVGRFTTTFRIQEQIDHSRRISPLNGGYPLGQKIATQIVEAGPWWDAEDYHQEYLHKNPSGYQCPTHRLHW
ncbi:hypothetical protein PHLCEN_2v7884 [Hermanssonia centrifuga]|uniref:peptide-methionine (S)-S-oxide reductase n=1 Tax=Hermanssonia centrifuga TaxID=98765 RepID=A0A2R6NVA0_9APHY|nr:hypothetical protein PHLCEN_2v7884 [Hermanssonia centrifuga]